ncbi:MAG: hypothetical protein ABJB22_06825 [Verrucomicrobiota bacterium]
MKPTPQITDTKQRNFPLTDYQFQSTVDLRTSAPAIRQKSISELRTFRKVSREFFATETRREYVIEFLLFALITGISAWPIVSNIAAMARMLRNY